jgi:hypothetical protein
MQLRAIVLWMIQSVVANSSCSCASSSPALASPASTARSAAPTASEALAPSKPEAASKPEATAGHSDADARASVCHGRATPELVLNLTDKGENSRACYERELRLAPKLAGRVVLAIHIADDGRVFAVDVKKDEPKNSNLRSCLVDHFTTAWFPPPAGGCIVATVPLRFDPKAPPDGGGEGAR